MKEETRKKWTLRVLLVGVGLLLVQGVFMLPRNPLLAMASVAAAAWFGYRLFRLLPGQK